MRTLICALLLSTAAYCQVGDSNTTIPDPSLSGSQDATEVIDLRLAATADSIAVPTVASSAVPGEGGTEMPLLSKTASGSGLSLTKNVDPPTARTRQIWYSMAFVAHGAAAFDGWTTRQVLSTGKGHEVDPLMKPFADSGAIYAALQVGPSAMDYLGLRMMRSHNRLYRRLWWVPQAASAAMSFTYGIQNIGVANR